MSSPVHWYSHSNMMFTLGKANNPAFSSGEVNSELWLTYMIPTSTFNAPQTLHRATSIEKCYNFDFKRSCENFRKFLGNNNVGSTYVMLFILMYYINNICLKPKVRRKKLCLIC